MKKTPPSETKPRAFGTDVLGDRAGRMRRRLSSVLLLTVLGWMVLLACAPETAQAHSELVATNPKDGARLTAPPADLTFTFSEGVAPTYAVVTLRIGTKEVAELAAEVKGDRVTAPVPVLMHGSGRWRAAYRIISADGHPVAGKIAFTVVAPPTSTPSATPTSPTSTPTADHSDDDRPAATSDRSDDGGGLPAGLPVLIIALLVSAPVVVFIVIGSRKRREDQKSPDQ